MSTTISKGRLFRASITINDKLMEQLKRAPQVAEAALQAGADYWHSGILPEHFKTGAAGVYGYAQRSVNYLRQKGKRGKPYLVFSGSMARDLKAMAQFKPGGSTGNIVVELKMRARVLNFVPSKENSDDLYVMHGGRGKSRKGALKRYPNLKREIKAFTDQDRERVAAVVAGVLEKAFGDTEGRESDD